MTFDSTTSLSPPVMTTEEQRQVFQGIMKRFRERFPDIKFVESVQQRESRERFLSSNAEREEFFRAARDQLGGKSVQRISDVHISLK